MTLISRDTARVLLLDPADRILLYRGRLLQVANPPYAWFTPGGGIDAGESTREAAARELFEELGHVVAPDALGPVVATSEGGWALDGRRYFSRDSYFLLRVDGLEVDMSGMDAEERAATDRFQWWTADELTAAREEPVVPRDLVPLLRRLVTGDLPDVPITLPWHLRTGTTPDTT